jgi:tRNA modification GTPase
MTAARTSPEAAVATAALLTPHAPGAIAIIQIGGDVVPVLRQLTGAGDWPIGRARLVSFGDIDNGIAVRLAKNVAQLMPHGGMRVVQRLLESLAERGVSIASADELDPQQVYPETADRIEALMLAAVARAASPLAIDLLLDQPRRWRDLHPSPLGRGARGEGDSFFEEDVARSRRLNRLIDPPLVLVASPANVGKSTLSNALIGRDMSIALDQPGTTRDFVSARIDLAGLVVDWHDTPGIRTTRDPIEAKAIDLASRLIERADLLIAMTDHEHDWPALPRAPDLSVINKIDLTGTPDLTSPPGVRKVRIAPGRDVLPISALTGAGLPALVAAARDALVPPADLAHPGPWLFDDRLL